MDALEQIYESIIHEQIKLLRGKVIPNSVDLAGYHLTELPDLSDVSVMGDFFCFRNRLKSLKGAAKYVSGSFVCDHNAVEFTEKDVRKVSKVKGGIYC